MTMATTEETSDFDQIRDPSEDDFNQRQRLKEIWDARRRVNEYREELAVNLGETIDQSRAERIYHQTLKQYIMVLHTLFVDVYPEPGQEVWFNAELGTQIVDPPPELNGQAKPQYRDFSGLKDILEAPAVKTMEFNEEFHQRHQGYTSVATAKTVTVPWNILDTALMTCNGFLSTVGLEAELKDDEPHDGFLDL